MRRIHGIRGEIKVGELVAIFVKGGNLRGDAWVHDIDYRVEEVVGNAARVHWVEYRGDIDLGNKEVNDVRAWMDIDLLRPARECNLWANWVKPRFDEEILAAVGG